MTQITQITQKPQLPQIKKHITNEIRRYLKKHQDEVLTLETINDRTQIDGSFFNDLLGDYILVHIPIDLKDILDLCFEEPNIVASTAKFTSGEPSTLTIMKDAIYFYLKDYVYRQIPKLMPM